MAGTINPWTITAAREGNMLHVTLSNEQGIVQGPFPVTQVEALNLSGYIGGLFGAATSSANMTATAATPSGGKRGRKAAARGRR